MQINVIYRGNPLAQRRESATLLLPKQRFQAFRSMENKNSPNVHTLGESKSNNHTINNLTQN